MVAQPRSNFAPCRAARGVLLWLCRAGEQYPVGRIGNAARDRRRVAGGGREAN
jgi:hypothetical protein